MLDSAKALFFGSSNYAAVLNETGGGVAVVRVEPQDVHGQYAGAGSRREKELFIVLGIPDTQQASEWQSLATRIC